MTDKGNTDGGVVWQGRPAIGVYVALYGVLALVAAGIIVGLEVYTARTFGAVSSFFYSSLKAGPVEIPYALEAITIIIIGLVLLVRVVGLVIVRTSNSYELRTDGLYVNKGIANLQNTFVSAMAFSDAKLTRTLGMRIVGRGRIVIEANDGRRFELRMIKDSSNVQAMIRTSLSHPTVRLEK
jgi:hypothetical protein